MTEQELKKLGRTELVRVILEQEKANDSLQERIIAMERQQRERSFRMKKFGSIAEASLQLNGVFEAAQRAANQYLESAAQMSAACKQEKLQADKILEEARKKCAQMEAETAEKCRAMLEKAEADAKAYWQNMERDLVQRLEDYVPVWHEGAVEQETEEAAAEIAAQKEEASVPAEETQTQEDPGAQAEPETDTVEEALPEEHEASQDAAEAEPEQQSAAVQEAAEPAAEEAPAEDIFDLDEIKRLLGDL